MKTHLALRICSATALILLLATLPALAMGPGPGGGMGRGLGNNPEAREAMMEARFEQMEVLLDLTPAQKEQLQTFRASHRAKGATFRQEMQAVRQEISDELRKPDMDMTRVTELQTRLKELLALQADHRLEGIIHARQTLTPEQFNKFMVLAKDDRCGLGPMGRRGCPPKE